MEADTAGHSLRDLSRLLRPLALRLPPAEWTLAATCLGVEAAIYALQVRHGMDAALGAVALVPALAAAWLGSRRVVAAVLTASAVLPLVLAAQHSIPWTNAVARAALVAVLGVLTRLAASGYAGTRAAAARLSLVSRISRVATSSSSLEDILREVLDDMARDGLRGGTILLVDEQNRLYIAAAHGEHLDESVRSKRLEFGQGIM